MQGQDWGRNVDTHPLVATIVHGDRVEIGYASHQWIVDLLEWNKENEDPYGAMIQGLVLGYSAEAIEKFITYQSGLRHLRYESN